MEVTEGEDTKKGAESLFKELLETPQMLGRIWTFSFMKFIGLYAR